MKTVLVLALCALACSTSFAIGYRMAARAHRVVCIATLLLICRKVNKARALMDAISADNIGMRQAIEETEAALKARGE